MCTPTTHHPPFTIQQDVQFSHDGTRFASASKDATAIIWSVPNEEANVGGAGGGGTARSPYCKPAVLHTLLGHTDGISFLAWSPDDTMLLTGGQFENSLKTAKIMLLMLLVAHRLNHLMNLDLLTSGGRWNCATVHLAETAGGMHAAIAGVAGAVNLLVPI